MKSIVAVAIFVFVLSINCFAQCEELDSFGIDNFISARQRIERRRNKKLKIIRSEHQIVTSSGIFTIDGTAESDFTGYPNDLMTWGIGFFEGLAKIVVNRKSGFINHNGQVVIKPKYKMASCFSEGLAAVEIRKKWGFINQKGKLIIPAKFDAAANFSDGLALIKIGTLWGYIDHSGKFEIEPIYEEAGSFSEGFAVVGYYDKDYIWTSHERAIGKWRRNFVNKQGKLIFSTGFDGISRNFNGGMALVSRNIGYKNGVISQSYFIDEDGNELWKWDSNLTWFNENLIVVTVNYNSETKRETYSFLDRDGKRVTEKVYDHLSGFSEGLAVASIKDKAGFINKTGEFVIEPKYDSADSFSEDLAAVYQKGKSGFIDTKGDWKIELRFEWTDGFKNGRAAVAVGEEIGYINRNGEYIWKPSKPK